MPGTLECITVQVIFEGWENRLKNFFHKTLTRTLKPKANSGSNLIFPMPMMVG